MKTGHILLKNKIEAIKTPFKDYELPNGLYVGKANITIKKGFIIAMNYNLINSLNLETIGEIKTPTQSEIIKEINNYNDSVSHKLAIKKEANLLVAVLTKNSNLLNANL
tara:strand:+ start:976 stop:1302 length:327 start_codon:yes stop_codon:yes gene_type:complete